MSISKRATWLLAILLSFALIATACGDDDDGAGSDGGGDGGGFVQISGSSTVEPISTRVKELFNDQVSGDVEITVNGPGTSAGFREFCPGNTDINDASRPIKDTEINEGGVDGGPCVDYVELEVAFDGIAVMVHPDNPLECVNLLDLYAISGPESEGNSWEDAAALAAELGSDTTGWPTGTVEVIAPGTESGTYGSFIELALEDQADARAEAGAVELQVDENGDDIFIRTDYAGQPDDNVILEGIAGSANGFGWVGFAFAEAAGDAVKILEVVDEDTGECVSPVNETIENGTYELSRSLYIYVNTARAGENPALASFVDFYLNGAYPDAVENAFADGVGYVALPDDRLQATRDAWAPYSAG